MSAEKVEDGDAAQPARALPADEEDDEYADEFDDEPKERPAEAEAQKARLPRAVSGQLGNFCSRRTPRFRSSPTSVRDDTARRSKTKSRWLMRARSWQERRKRRTTSPPAPNWGAAALLEHRMVIRTQ